MTDGKLSVQSGMSRRRFISLTGGGVVLAAGAGISGFALTRTPHNALSPWSNAGNYSEPRRFALSYAILAPNPHNLQPWLVDLSEPDQVTLLPDPARRLPETDPYDRQLTIGLGCFLEQMSIAAFAAGYRLDTELFPDGQDSTVLGDRPVATARFISTTAQPDPLFDVILQRRSTKAPFDMQRDVDPGALESITPVVPGIRFNSTVDPDLVASIRALTWKAFQVEYTTPAKLMESIKLMRFGRTEINAQPDGIDIGGMPLEGLHLLGLLSREAMARPGSMSYTTGLNMYREMLEATPAYVWLTSVDNNRESQIHAGSAWLRLNLLCTRQGLALHPVSQCLQEYPEMSEHYSTAHRLMAQTGETVQMLGRLGYASPVPPTPRWTLDEKIKTA